MQCLYVYDGALIVIGISFGLEAILALGAGQSSISLWLMAVGGGGMVVAALYETVTTDPESYSVNTYVLGGLVFTALLSLTPTIIQLIE